MVKRIAFSEWHKKFAAFSGEEQGFSLWNIVEPTEKFVLPAVWFFARFSLPESAA